MILPAARSARVTAIDVLRGIIMIIMALDHVRDFFHISAQTADPLDLKTTAPLLFFTRWITHFCAPAFVFLAGTSAFLSSKNKPAAISSTFMIKRGVWLVLADVVIMSFALTFNPSYHFIMLTVLWSIGCSMILLGIILKLSFKLILPLALLLFICHDAVTTNLNALNGTGSGWAKILFTGLYIIPAEEGHVVGFLYSILPYTGVMLLGYWFGRYVTERKTVFITGLSLFIVFVIIRLINLYGDPQPWHFQSSFLYTLLSFLNTSKYPPSLQFLTMTLGPCLMLLAALMNMRSGFQRLTSVYGKVPFFYYVLHIFLAHVILVFAFYLTGHSNKEIFDPQSPFLFRPRNFGFSLPVVYAVWAFVVVVLYYPCGWFLRYKKDNNHWWLKYV